MNFGIYLEFWYFHPKMTGVRSYRVNNFMQPCSLLRQTDRPFSGKSFGIYRQHSSNSTCQGTALSQNKLASNHFRCGCFHAWWEFSKTLRVQLVTGTLNVLGYPSMTSPGCSEENRKWCCRKYEKKTWRMRAQSRRRRTVHVYQQDLQLTRCK